MGATLPDEGEYPYASHSTWMKSAEPEIKEAVRFSAFLKWVGRFVLVAVALLLIFLVGVGIELRRSYLRWSRLQDLTLIPGCSISYAHEYPFQEDQLPEFLREWLGPHVWTEVLEFSHLDWSPSRADLNAAQVELACDACARLPRLRSFTMMSDHFSCEQMKDWSCLATLEELYLASSKISDVDLEVIGRMKRLKSLTLNSGTVSAKGLAQLETLPHLETLNLTTVEFVGSTDRGVTKLPMLKRLEIEDCPLMTDDAILAMGELPALEELVSNRTPLGDRTVEHIVGNGKIHILIMNQSDVTDTGLKLLGGFAHPISLHLADTRVTDEGLRSIAGIQLESLDLDGTAITDDGLKALKPLRGLSYLSLDKTKLCGTGLGACDPTNPIRNLTLRGAPLTREGIKVLANLSVDSLWLENTPITDNDLLLFANNDLIKTLYVEGTKITAVGIKKFYEQRKKRLIASRQPEGLLVVGEYGGIAEEYLPECEHYRIFDAFDGRN